MQVQLPEIKGKPTYKFAAYAVRLVDLKTCTCIQCRSSSLFCHGIRFLEKTDSGQSPFTSLLSKRTVYVVMVTAWLHGITGTGLIRYSVLLMFNSKIDSFAFGNCEVLSNKLT